MVSIWTSKAVDEQALAISNFCLWDRGSQTALKNYVETSWFMVSPGKLEAELL